MMKKTRRRVLAVMLAAAMAFTSPGTASYAGAENEMTAAEDISDSGSVASPEVEGSTVDEAGTDESMAGESGTEGSSDAEPGTDEGTAAEPGTDEGTAAEPGTDEGTAAEPGTDEGIANVPGTGESTAAEPGTGEGTANMPGAEDAIWEAAGLCAHHQEHTQDCGYKPTTGDEAGSPCAFACRICRMEKLLQALPEEATGENAGEVQAQLGEILALYTELTEEEQGQVDISRCLELQAALGILGRQNHAGNPALIGEAVSYLDCDANGQNWVTKTCEGYTAVTSGTSNWSDGWYVVSGEVTINSRISVSGTVHLILMDNCVLKADQGISVNEGQSLTIYAQSIDSKIGSLEAVATNGDYAGIGGESRENAGTITINGGSITAVGGGHGAGIGGGIFRAGGIITVNGGSVMATGGRFGAGIGGGYGGGGGTITVNGGSVTAAGDEHGAGIGGGSGGSGGTITVNDGSVTATGGRFGAGIGGGNEAGGGTITVNGGGVTAVGGEYGAGIGGGNRGGGGTITVNDGSVTATGGELGTSIGGGSGGGGGTLNTLGGTVNGTNYYTVTFDWNGMEGVQIPVQGIAQGEKATEPGVEKEGYRIEGWYTDQEYKTPFDFNTPINSDRTLYAKWIENTDCIANVTIDDHTVGYTTISSAWKALGGKTGTITFLRNVTTTETLTVSSEMNVTVQMEENVTFENTANDCFKVDGGTLTLAGGKVVESGSGKSIVYAASGTLCMTGGAYESAANGLWVDKGVTVRLSGGTISASNTTLRYDSSKIVDMLDKTQEGRYFAFYKDGALLTSGLDGSTLSGSYTVKECSHADELQQGKQDKHFKRCSACGRETEYESHRFENTNTCTVCGAERVARVEMDGAEAADYVSLEGAWTALDGKTGTITLLRNVTTTETLTVNSKMNVTVEMAEGVTLENTQSDCFKVDGGALTLASGRVVESGSSKPSIVYAPSGTFCMTGGTYESNANGVWADKGVTVRLSGGTVRASGTAFRYGSSKVTDMLDRTQEGKYFVFYDSSGNLITSGLDGEKSASGTYTVKECTHAYEKQQGNQDTHYELCPVCGSETNREPHTYKDGKCEGCGVEILASVTVGEQTSYYPTLTAAWAAAQGKTATLTILQGLALTDNMEMTDAATDLTVKAEEGVIVNSTSDFFIVRAGKLALESGTYVSSGSGKSGIYMTDGTVEMSGGSIKMTGSGDTKGIQINGSGTLHISGGTLEVKGNSSGHALLVSKGTVRLTGVTLINDAGNAVTIGDKGQKISDLLGEGCFLYNSEESLVTDGLGGTALTSGTYYVKAVCNHAYVWETDVEMHYQKCSVCGDETEHEQHIFEGTTCKGCGLELVASVVIEGKTTYYGSFENAWSAVSEKTGTIKLWNDVVVTSTLTISRGMDVTLEMEEGVTFKNTAQDCFRISGGTLTLASGTVVEEKAGKSIVYAASGCLNVTGGTYRSSGNGLWVDSGAEVQLSGGTIIVPNGTALRYQSPRIVREMLKQPQDGSYLALYDGNNQLVTAGMDKQELPSGTYTVDVCKHAYQWQYDQDMHYRFCPVCGDEKEREPHTFNHNVCDGCGLVRVASVETGGKTNYYASFDDAWSALFGATGTIKLWKDVEVTKYYTVSPGMDVTLEMEEGVTFTNTERDCFRISGGTLTLASGTVVEEGGGDIVYVMSGALNITGGLYKSNGSGLWVDSNVKVQLSGGKLIVPNGPALQGNSSCMIRDMLKHSQENQYFALYDVNDKLITEGMEERWLPSGTYTIRECTHDYKQRYDKETHYRLCSACGSEKDREKHSFGGDGFCTVCGAGDIIRVESGGETTDYMLLDEAWAAVQGRTATLTFLKSLSLETSMTVSDSDTDLTVKAAEGVTVSSTSDFFLVRTGKLSISGGAYESSGDGGSGIYMTGGSVEMSGGSIKMTGTGETKAIRVSGGSLEMSGGTLEVSGNEAGAALFVSYGGRVSLSGGTLIGGTGRAVDAENSWWDIKDLLAEGYVIYDSSNTLLTEELFNGSSLESGPYTVKLCSHNYVGVWEDEEYHYLCCSICGEEGELEAHTFQDGVCTVCGFTAYAVSVEIGGVSTYYDSLEAAWSALKGKKGTITLWKSVKTDQTLVVDADMDVTVEMNEGVDGEGGGREGGVLLNFAGDCFQVNGGTLTLASGQVVSVETPGTWIANVTSGVLRVTGGMYFSGAGNGFYADSGATVQLSGGNFGVYGEEGVVLRYGAPRAVRDMLAQTQEGNCFALYCWGSEDGEGIVPGSLLEGDSLKAGEYSVMPVTVALDGTEEPVYDGTAKEPEVTVSLWDDYYEESIELTAGTDYEVSYSNNINAGTDAVITVTGKAFNGTITQKFTIGKGAPAIGKVTAEMPENTLDASQAILGYENGSIAGTLKLADDTALKYGSNTCTWTFTPKDTQNYREITGEVEVLATDTIAPTASYRIDTDGWKKFINTLSFGLFCKDYKKVTISAADDAEQVTGSGVAEIKYYISGQWISDEEIAETENLKWVNYEEAISLDGAGTYFIYVKVSDQAGNTAVYNSEGIVIYRESALSPSVVAYTYGQEQDCTVQLTLNGNTFKELRDDGGNVIDAAHYAVDGNGVLTLKGTYLDTLSQGAHACQVIMNPQGVETDKAALEYAFTVQKKPAELTITGAAAAGRPYDGTNAVEITAVTLSGILRGDDVGVYLKGVRGEISGVNAGTYSSVTLPELTLTGAAKGNYTLIQPREAVPASVVIGKAEVGSAVENTLNRSYLYSRESTDRISLTEFLPRDCGTVSYGKPVISGNVIYSEEPAVNAETLFYTLKNGNIGDEGTITVTVTTQNYKDIIITVTVKLSDKIPVRLKEGTEVTLDRDTLVYGEAFSELGFKEAEFVDLDGNPVEGTLAWKNASIKPDVGTIRNVWVFTPHDTAYASVEGMMIVTVRKAVPVVSAIPTAAAWVYNPSRSLTDSDLSGGLVTGVDGNPLEGAWSWEKADIVPTVDNRGYRAVFTPADAGNYETAVTTVSVTVAKAVPYVVKLPSAGRITYGDALNASVLSGGIAQYGNGAGQPADESGSTEKVDGTFAWKDGALKPAAADSGVTGYTVVFMPSDMVNYETAEGEITLEVKKADSAPNMPDSVMEVPYSCEKVSDAALPEGWEWQEGDRDIFLETGTAVSVVAVYIGADRGNYEKETVTLAITRAVCSHANTERKNAKEATCQETGYTGDIWCIDCGKILEAGTEIPLTDHLGGTATCIRRAVCRVCGQEYGTVDAGNHEGSTEVRNSVAAGCTEGGYTGDIYCKACGAKTETGTAIPVLGHDYTGKVTKEPTEDSEGIMTYTCRRCGDSYTESIDRLEPGKSPEPGSTPEPGKTPGPGSTPEPGKTPELGKTPGPGSTPEPGKTPEPGSTPEPGKSPEPGSTPEPGKTPEPGNSPNPGDTPAPESGIPFIKGENGKIGWNVIRTEEEKAEEGSCIHVDMNGTAVVPGDIFDSIRGRDVTITFDMGGGILWSVDGKKILTDQAEDIDFSVRTGTDSIPVDIVNNVTGERCSLQLSLSHNGEFGFTAVLSIHLGTENAGFSAKLYYYNRSEEELELVCVDKVAENGTASFVFTHASDYIIVVDKNDENDTESPKPENPQVPDTAAGDTDVTAESPKTGQPEKPVWPVVTGILILTGIGIVAALVWRRRKREEEDAG